MRLHKMVVTFFAAFFLLATLGSFSLYAEEELIKGKPTLPGKSCQTEPLPNWTPQEKWVWRQVCEGKIADFNKRYGIVLDPKDLDPEKPEEWPKNRMLTPRFLETILLHEPYRGALTRHGVQIVGAWFKEPLDLSDATLAHSLWLGGSRFDSKVVLDLLKTNHSIKFEKSTFFKELILIGTKIDGQLDMAGSKCISNLRLDSLQVGSSLFMCEDAEFNKEVNIFNVIIGGAFEMDGSKFTGKLHIEALEVANSMFMRFKGAEFPEVVIYGAKIGGNLNLSGGTFKSFNLTNTIIGREFRLSSVHTNKEKDNLGAAKWQKDSKLTLRNTKVGILQDSKNSWPNNLELEGFTYEYLGKFIADNNKDLSERDIIWFIEWLGKQKKFTPQPYEHLASVLQKSGKYSMANKILYAGKEHKRKEATWINWFGLMGMKLVIGYGYGYRIFVSLIWVIFFGGIGTILLRINKEGKKRNIVWCIFYSLDLLLPIIKLDERHYKIELEGFAKYYFYFHIVIGFILASFVAAGISGLVQ